MYPAPFALERYFARREFSARYLLSASDCQGPAMAELVAMTDDDLRARWRPYSSATPNRRVCPSSGPRSRPSTARTTRSG